MNAPGDEKKEPGGRSSGILVEAYQKGDRDAFDQLVMRYQDRVYTLCYRFLGDREDAYDCAQESFIKVFRGLRRFQGKSHFYTWLYRIVINTCKNRAKTREYRARKQRVPLSQGEPRGAGNPGVVLRNGGPPPDEQIVRRERAEQVQAAIAALPEEQRTIVLLRDMEELSYEEIAQITELELGTVKSRLSRSRTALRKRLQKVI